jgi:hypothetical protein
VAERIPDDRDLQRLREIWEQWTGPKETLAELLPARLVTLVEMFCRRWVQKLIDYGAPYDERATDLKVEVKFDLALVRSVHAESISLGLLLSNSLPLTSVSGIASVFNVLLDHDFFAWLARVRARSHRKHEGDESAAPILNDIGATKSGLSRLFDIRNVLVHEFPENRPFRVEEIDSMISMAAAFMNAADEGFTQLIYGFYPLDQAAMTQAAREECAVVVQALETLTKEIEQKTTSDTITKVQEAWGAFAEAEAHRCAEGWSGGTGYPMIYAAAFKVIASDRLRQLHQWFDEFKDQLGLAMPD